MLQKGFTLIELMIVVAIIGILSMFALPAYQDYTKRTYVSEGMALSTAAKMATTEYFSTEGKWPANNSDAGLPAPGAITGQAVTAISIITGKPGKTPEGTAVATDTADVANINIFYNHKVIGAANTLTGGIDTAGTAVVADKNSLTIAPVTLKDDQGSVQWVCLKLPTDSNIQPKWLPANCRTQADKNAVPAQAAATGGK